MPHEPARRSSLTRLDTAWIPERLADVTRRVRGGWARSVDRLLPTASPSARTVRHYAPWASVLAGIALYPYVMGEFWALNGSFIAVYAVIALSITVLTGWAGPVTLGQAAFVGLGAFLSAYLTDHGVNFLLWFPLAVAASVPVSLVISAAAFRLPGLYFAVATLAFGIAAQFMIFIPIENAGYTVINRPEIGSVDFADERLFFLLCVAIVGVVFGAVIRIGRGRAGRALLAVRSSETGARAAGIDAARYKTAVFVLSGAVATVGGVLLGTLIESARSNQFTPFDSIGYLAITIIGGLGSILGAVLAGVMHVMPTEILRPFVEGSTLLTQFSPLLLASLLVVLIVFRPDGLLGLIRSLGVRAGLVAPRPRREVAFLGGTGQTARAEIDFELGDWDRPAGAFAGVLGELSAARELALDGAAPALAVDDVSVRFGAIQALDGVSLTVEPGEIVGIIGPNGAGKTTLFNVISGFQAPETGSVRLDGHRIDGLPAATRAIAGLGRTFQTPRLVGSMSVFDNLLVGAEPRLEGGIPSQVAGFTYAVREEWEARAQVGHLLEVLGLSALSDRAASDLPSGLLKVVEVGQALVLHPHVLLLDEPSAGLDPSETRWLGDLIRSLNEDLGISVALIEHDMSLVMGLSDHVYVLESGRTLASGTPEEVRGDTDVVAAYLGTQAVRA